MKKSLVLIACTFVFLASCKDWPWPKGKNGTALECRGIVTDTRLKPNDVGYEELDVDMYGWSCVPPEYLNELQKSAFDLEGELKKCKMKRKR